MARKVKRKNSSHSSAGRAPASQPPSQKLLRDLDTVHELTRKRQWSAALQLLQPLNDRYPNRREILAELVDVTQQLQAGELAMRYTHDLYRLVPNDPDIQLLAAGAYGANGFPSLCVATFQQFLNRHPEHDRAAEIARILPELQSEMGVMFAHTGYAATELLTLMPRHDELRFLLAYGNYPEARRVGHALIAEYPTFAPAYNNLSQVEALEGDYDTAMNLARQVLAFDPANFQARANLARFAHLVGNTAEAQTQLANLQNLALTDNLEYDLKLVETLAVLGEDAAVLAEFTQRIGNFPADTQAEQALLHHYAAVATMHLGDEAAAKQYWQTALQFDPGFDLAKTNLADLRKPVGERHTPWLYSLFQWIPRSQIEELVRLTNRYGKGEKVIMQAGQRFIAAHPALLRILPILLEQGDPQGREFAVNLIAMAKTPALMTVLHEFARSQHGPDQLRVRAMNLVVEAGLQSPGMVELWIAGEWRELLLMNFEIHGEQLHRHSRQVTNWMTEALQRAGGGDFTGAEALLRRALAAEPKSPDILNNLAALYEKIGRHAETAVIAERIFTDFPDYLFGQITRSRELTMAGDVVAAEAILQRVTAQKRLHYTEFNALCAAHIQLALAKGQIDGAQTWLDMWANAEPENPQIAIWKREIAAAKRGRTTIN